MQSRRGPKNWPHHPGFLHTVAAANVLALTSQAAAQADNAEAKEPLLFASNGSSLGFCLLGNASMAKDGCAQDFDFQIGDWFVRHRRLNGRLVGSTDWQGFDRTCSMRTIMAGQGNIEDNQIHLPGGSYRAVALRSFDPLTRSWAIWWLDARNPHGLAIPVVGSFNDGIGTFFADDVLDGQPIRVRFTWRTSDACFNAPPARA